MMVPPAVAEQQAKLGVSAEESKAQRLKRQQARFRDRGGAFVPSTTNHLVDILLARTVSGESPSKACSKDGAARRVSPRKPRQTLPTCRESQAIAGSSKAQRATSRKGGKGKAVQSPAESATEPPPKGRGTKKGRKKTEDRGSDAEQPIPANTKSKPASKRKGKQRTVPSTSDGNPNPKPKARAKTKPTRVVVEILDSDEDQTLVEVLRKTKSIPRKNIQYDDDGETDDDAPIIRKKAKRRVEDSKVSRISTVARVKTERIAAIGCSVKELDEREERRQDEKCSKLRAKKRLVWCDEDEDEDEDGDEVEVPPAKKGKKSTTIRPTATLGLEPTPPSIKDVRCGKNAKGAGGKGKVEPDRHIAEAKQDDKPLPKPEPKKRKMEDNYDDRPRKVVKFAETSTTYSSQKLKENQSDKKCKRTPKSGTTDEMDALRPKLSTNPPRAKTPKGPPLEVLRRIKASAARHLRCVDSEPDELDCLP